MFDELTYLNGKLYRGGKEAGWLEKSNGYRALVYHGKRYLTHRVIWYMHYGAWPINDVDHINQDRLDNRIENLRDVSRSINLRNQKRIKGVHRHQGKWRAMMSINNKSKHIGMFDTEDEARAAYVAAINQ